MKVDGIVALKSSERVSGNALIEIEALSAPTNLGLVPENVEFTVLYQDEDLVVIDKPSGIVVHPGELQERGTLVHGLLARFPDLATAFAADDERRPGIVHRLDRGTSGVMVVARTQAARLKLVEAFQSRNVRKTYIAWVFGNAPESGIWDGPIARHPRDRKRFAVVSHGKPALTSFRTVARGDKTSKLEVDIKTGRTHQIRVHASASGHALLGDAVYRKRGVVPTHLRDWAPERCRPALHAWRLRFLHPRDDRELEFEAALPEDLLELDRRYAPI